MSLRGKVRKLPFTEEQISSMIDDYRNNVPLNEIYEKYHVREDQLRYIRRKHCIPARLTHVQKTIAEAVNAHVNGMLLKDVIAKYGISSPPIYKYMKENGIVYKNGHGRKYHFNEGFFEIIDNEHKSYWLGFLYADGSVGYSEHTCNSPNRLSINLSYKDRCIIESILEDLEADCPIKDYMPDERTYGNSMMSRVCIDSTRLCNDLIRHGCIPNKTHFLQFPYGSMQEKFYPHFIRGLFDGDGCITGQRKIPSFEITGYPNFLLQVQNILIKNCGLNKTSLQYYPHKSPDVATLRYGGPNVVRRIFDFLYQDASIFLPRKYEKFTSLFSQ